MHGHVVLFTCLIVIVFIPAQGYPRTVGHGDISSNSVLNCCDTRDSSDNCSSYSVLGINLTTTLGVGHFDIFWS